MQHAPPTTLETLYREHHALVYTAAYRVTGSASDAEDVLQSVFLRLMQRTEAKDLTELGARPESYLCRAAINHALDLLRSRKRIAADAFDEQNSKTLFSSVELNPQAQHESLELKRVIRRTLAGLSGRTAEAFALKYFEGHGNAEIAQMLNTSPIVVGVLLHRARRALQNELKKFLEK